MHNIVYKKEYRIRITEIDSSKRITVPGFMQLMQDASLQHVIDLKASIWDMKDSGWVLLVKELNIIRLPELGEMITVETYPAGCDKIFAYRDYKVYDQKGNIIAYAPSTWALIDISTRSIQRIPAMIYELKLNEDIVPLDKCERKIDIPRDLSPVGKKHINYFNLDWNGHVNNVNYLKFVLESNTDKIGHSTPTKIIMHFKGEAIEGDTLIINNSPEFTPKVSNHIITREGDSKVMTAVKIYWD